MTGRFLIATWDGGGNTPPALNLGARLVRHGHRVRLVGWASLADRALAAGLEFAAYPSVPAWPSGVSLDEAWDERVLPALHGPATRDDILDQAADFGPDVIVVDTMMGAGFDAAARLARPTVALVHVLYAGFRYEWGQFVLGRDVAPLLDGADATLVAVPPGFDAPCVVPPTTRYVGPITDPSPAPLDADDLDLLTQPGEPWVLLSLSSTLQGQADALPAMLDALAVVRVRAMLTLGGVLSADAIDPPPNVVVRGYVPHAAVLPHVAAVISHGGLSTISGALAAGVPLVCVPQGRDQAGNAMRVDATGVGRCVAPGAPPAELASAVEAVLADADLSRRARHFASVIADLGAGDTAAGQVAALQPARR